MASDVSILGLPDDRRQVFASEWDEIVERAVLSGVVTLDERGRLKFRGARRGGRDREPEGDGDA